MNLSGMRGALKWQRGRKMSKRRRETLTAHRLFQLEMVIT